MVRRRTREIEAESAHEKEKDPAANNPRVPLQLQPAECWHDAVRQLLARVLSQGISCCCTEVPLRIEYPRGRRSYARSVGAWADYSFCSRSRWAPSQPPKRRC